MKRIKVINLLPFCKTGNGDIGIAQEGLFASSAWIIGQSAGGRKFGWYASNGQEYVEDVSIMSRPSEQEVVSGLSSSLRERALNSGYIEMEDEDDKG
jgi:hypothetical protein